MERHAIGNDNAVLAAGLSLGAAVLVALACSFSSGVWGDVAIVVVVLVTLLGMLALSMRMSGLLDACAGDPGLDCARNVHGPSLFSPVAVVCLALVGGICVLAAATFSGSMSGYASGACLLVPVGLALACAPCAFICSDATSLNDDSASPNKSQGTPQLVLCLVFCVAGVGMALGAAHVPVVRPLQWGLAAGVATAGVLGVWTATLMRLMRRRLEHEARTAYGSEIARKAKIEADERVQQAVLDTRIATEAAMRDEIESYAEYAARVAGEAEEARRAEQAAQAELAKITDGALRTHDAAESDEFAEADEVVEVVWEGEALSKRTVVSKLGPFEGEDAFLYLTTVGRIPGIPHDQKLARQCLTFAARYHLTVRQTEVIYLLTLGFNRKRIAEYLRISTTTVHTHMRHIYESSDIHDYQSLIETVRNE